MEKELLIELSEKVREKELELGKARRDKVDAEVKAWQSLDFEELGDKLARQKELRVKLAIDGEIRNLQHALAEYEYYERLFYIQFNSWLSELEQYKRGLDPYDENPGRFGHGY